MLRRVILWALLVLLLPIRVPAAGRQLLPEIERSERFFLDGHFEEALAVLDTVAMTVEGQMEPAVRLLLASQRSKIEIFWGLISRDKARYAVALAMLRTHQEALSDVHDPDIRAAFLSALAYAHLYNGHRDTAFAQFREAIKLYSEGTDQNGAALTRAFEIMMHLGKHRRSGNTKAMVDLVPVFIAEIEFARQAGNPMAVSYNQRHLAAIYREGSRELDKSLDLYQASLETRKKIGFRPLLPASYSSVGDLLADLGRIEAAIEMYTSSAKSAEEIGFRRYQFEPRLKIGDLLRIEGQISLARSYYEEALQAAMAEEFQDGIGEVRRRLDGLH